MKKYRSPRELLAVVDEVLATKPRLAPRGHTPRAPQQCGREDPLGEIAGVLHNGRQYFVASIYLAVGEHLLRRAHCGPQSCCYVMAFSEGTVGRAARTGAAAAVPDVTRDPDYKMCFPETRSELAVPIKIAGRVLGVIDAESERPNAFAAEDRVLLKEVAQRLARFLTGRGKYLVLKAREAAMLAASATSEPTQPERELHAAVGEKVRS